jgi:hypothetical protein
MERLTLRRPSSLENLGPAPMPVPAPMPWPASMPGPAKENLENLGPAPMPRPAKVGNGLVNVDDCGGGGILSVFSALVKDAGRIQWLSIGGVVLMIGSSAYYAMPIKYDP